MSKYSTARTHYKTAEEAQAFCDKLNASLSPHMRKKSPAHYFYNPWRDSENVKHDMYTCFYPHKLGTPFAA